MRIVKRFDSHLWWEVRLLEGFLLPQVKRVETLLPPIFVPQLGLQKRIGIWERFIEKEKKTNASFR